MKTITLRFLSALLLVSLFLARPSASPAYTANSTVNSFSSSVAATVLPGVRFVHIATASNTTDNYTCIDHPRLNGNPNAIFFVTQNWNPGGGSGIDNNQRIGVLYHIILAQWCIFNQGGSSASMPVGAAFNVFIPSAGSHVFVHTATSGTGGNIGCPWNNCTYLNHPMLNNNPNAIFLVTQNWNPGGGSSGVYNNDAIGVWYDSSRSRWAISNLNAVAMPNNASFNVVVADPTGTAFVHTATSGNIPTGFPHTTVIDHPSLNGNPNAIVLVTSNLNPGGGTSTDYNHEIGVGYDSIQNKWAIFNKGGGAMPVGASFNVLIPDTRADVFVHKATTDNIVGRITSIDHPLLNNNPNAIFFVTPNWNPSGVGGIYNNQAIGVWYGLGKWHILNQGTAADMPVGASFNVLIPPPGANVFIHKATSGNIFGSSTFIDHPLLNGNPNAVFLVTQNQKPGGVDGAYNNHAIGVWYDSAQNKWAIFNEDGVAMPDDANFNVMVLNDLTALPWSKAAFVHTATGSNTRGNWTALNHPLTNGIPPAFVFATHNFNPGGGESGTYNDHHIGVWYTYSNSLIPNKWAIFNQDRLNMPNNASFNVLVIVRQLYLPLVVK